LSKESRKESSEPVSPTSLSKPMSSKETNSTKELNQGDFSLSLIPQNLMSQKRGWRDFSAHSRNCKPFQLFCIAPKSKLSPASDLKNTQTSLTIHPPSIFVKNTQKNAALVTFYANRLCIAYPPTTELSLGSPQGKS